MGGTLISIARPYATGVCVCETATPLPYVRTETGYLRYVRTYSPAATEIAVFSCYCVFIFYILYFKANFFGLRGFLLSRYQTVPSTYGNHARAHGYTATNSYTMTALDTQTHTHTHSLSISLSPFLSFSFSFSLFLSLPPPLSLSPFFFFFGFRVYFPLLKIFKSNALSLPSCF